MRQKIIECKIVQKIINMKGLKKMLYSLHVIFVEKKLFCNQFSDIHFVAGEKFFENILL